MRKISLAALLLASFSSCAPPPAVSLPATVQSSGSAAAVAKFCEINQGRKVGDGECWALANEAFKAAGKKRPGRDLRVWGRVVDPKREEVRAGDIVEFESAIFADGVRTGPNHTAVVTVGGSDGLLTVAEQNFIGMKRVTTRPMNLNSRLYGRVTVYRPQ
jgi:hypothetical protein